jgi:hypothetical protein
MISSKTNLKKNYSLFGILQINVVKLYDNILMLSYKTGSPFTKIKTQKISDDLQSLLIDIVETEAKNEINENTAGRLSDKERMLFKDLLNVSGLTKDLKYKQKPRTIQQVVERFKLLQGSVDAGNDSRVVINEAIELLKILVLAGKVEAQEADNIIKDFETI